MGNFNEDMEQISAAASHDLRDPLRMALQHCKTLSADGASQNQEAHNAIVQCINTTIANIEVIRKYTYLAQNTEVPKPVMLETVLQKAKSNNAALIAQRNAVIRWSNAELALNARPAQLELMFTHIFDNALKYNDHPAPLVQVAISTTPQQCRCIVTDNGIGMEPEFAFLVMGLFKRVNPNGAIRGLGAGLAYAKKVVENHGGCIRIECNESQGCSVDVVLSIK